MKNNSIIFKLTTLWCFVFMGSTMLTAAPQLPSECKVFLPDVLDKYIYKASELESLINPKNNKNAYGQGGNSTFSYWKVYSDRSNNICYENSTGTTTCGTLDFGDELYIAMIANGRALVYKEPSMGGLRFPQISAKAESRGWVPMDHLLLWSLCPTNDRYIHHKALIVANMDKITSDPDFSFSFTNPVTKEGKQTLKSRMEFLYVMKTDKETGKVLLAKESRVGGYKNFFYGWVSQGTYIEWEERTCLELTWDATNRSHLQQAAIKSVPVRDIKSGNVLTSVEFNSKNKVSSNNPQEEWRLDPHVLRYPLLEDGNNDYTATIFAREGHSSNMQAVSNAAAAQQMLEHRIEAMRTVNLIIVIDGTKGMESSFGYVQRAVEKAYNEFFLKENREVKVGGVIYRDYGYTKDGRQCQNEVFPMMSIKDSRLKTFFSGGLYGIKDAPSDKNSYEALYAGIDKALDANAMNYDKYNSNLMIVIGDCGNRKDDTRCPSQEAIINKCVDNRIQLSAFQVRNLDTPESNWFVRQMSTIVRENMARQYTNASDGKAEGRYKDVKDGSNGSDFVPNVNDKNKYFIGGYRYPQPNTELGEKTLYALLKSTSQRFDEAMSKQVSLVDNAESVVTDQGGNDSKDNVAAVASFEKSYLKNLLGENTYNLLSQNQYMMAKIGRVPKASDGGVNFWKPVVYISKPEFAKLMEGLGIVHNGIDQESPNLRHDYVEAMKELVRAMLPGYSETQMNKMSNEQIMNQIEGLNYRTTSMNSFSLTDILDETVVSNEKFQALISTFSDRYKALLRIRDGKYTFSTKRGNETYYWLPAETLP